MININCGYLPPIVDDLAIENRELIFDSIRIQVPAPNVEQLKIMIERMKNDTSEISLTETIAAIDKATICLLDRQNSLRKKYEKILPIITGYDSEILRLALTKFLLNFRQHELRRWVAENFENPNILEEFVPRIHGGYSRAFAPQMCAHIWAGNVPALPLWSLVANLLVKGKLIGKVSSSEPSFIGLFCQLLIRIEPKLANKLAIVSWQGGDKEREQTLIDASDCVLAYRNNQTMAAIQAKLSPTSHFIAFGNKLSFGLIHHQLLNAEKVNHLVHEAAKAVVYYDQQGCYSPQIYFVEGGGQVSPREFALMLAGELRAYENRYPLRKLSLEEAYLRSQWREEIEWQGGCEFFPAHPENWLVTYSQALTFRPSPLSRVIQVIAVDQWEDIDDLLVNKLSILQSVGVAAPTESLFKIANHWGKLGVTRVTSLSAMMQVHSAWNSDGYSLLRELVRIVDIDSASLRDSERWNSYRD